MKINASIKAQVSRHKAHGITFAAKPFVIHRILPYLLFLISYLLFTSYAMAQKQFNYDTAWKKVTAAQDKGLPKTALEEVNKIYAAAKLAKDDGQQIKALIFQATLNQNVTENSQIKTIQQFEAEMKTAAEPARSILASIAADAYWNYLQQNRYKFYNRTATTNFNKDSVDTWAITDFNKKIADLYAISVANKSTLEKIKLDAFEPIIIKGNARKLRPTLYDLLAHKALDYYKTEEYDLVKPAYAFTLNDAAVLADANGFLKYKPDTKDSTNLQWKAVQLFQSLIKFHESDVDKAAFVDVDIERISWIHEKAVMPEKEQLYKKALEDIYAKYLNNEEAMQAGYLLAAWWQEKAGNYKAGGTEEDRLGYVKAVEIAKSVVAKFPKTQWANNCQNVINTITKKNIQITVEKVNEPNKPFRALVKYTNASEVNLSIVAQTAALKNNSDENGEGYNEDKFWKTVTSLSKVKSWQQALPTTIDYREHSVEIAIDPLAVGEFYLLSSGDAKFSLDKNPLAAAMFYNSNISFVQNGKEVFVLNRSTGQPLANATLQVWASRYDYTSRKYIKNKLEKIITDKNGYAKMQEHANEDRNLSFEINWQSDHLFLTDNIYDYQRNNYDDRGQLTKEQYEKGAQRFFFFTDRSIYRPGQLVYFKAIGITKDFDTRQTKLIQSGQSFKVILKDVNNQNVDTISLKLNDFGSMNGKFKLPENLLNGQFSLAVGDGYNNRQYFSVEEYKRPKFLVDFDTVKGSYHVNDEVKVVGNAKAYAGNKVDGAAVKYRVKRNVRFLYPWMWWRRPMPSGEEMEITNGETVTKADGTFEIVFKAIPDLSLAKETDPVFDYSVEADVTDINGETRSSTTLVPVGYKALDLKITIPQNGILPNDSLKNIFVSSKNLSGQFEPVQTTIKIYQLVSPDRLLRKRYWEAPDTTAMDYKTFIQKFPNDPYRDEQDYHSWAKGKEVLSEETTTTLNSSFTIHHSPFTQGWYVVEATAKDKFGQDVKAVEWFQLYDLKSKSLPSLAYNWENELNTTVEPGEKAQVLTGTSADNVFVIQQEVRVGDKGIGSKPLSTLSFINLNNEKNTNSFSTTESDRGGFNINRFFVKDNRIYTFNWNINVPWTNKQLDVSFNTFRDKLQPGAEEKWSVTIKGSKGEKVAAEMVASMYDASLDQFKPHDWTVPNIWPTNYFNNNWSGAINFSQIDGRVKYWNDEAAYVEGKMYDELLTLNFDRPSFSRNYVMVRGKKYGVINQVGTKDEGIVAPPMEMRGAGMMMASAPKVEIAKFTPPKIVPDGDGAKDISDSIFFNLSTQKPEPDFSNVTIRKNFNETAFFFPDLHTDAEGNISFSFTMPEALTKWKLQTLAHTKELAFGFAEKTTVTQKDLMIQPNAPRFLREGDRMEFSAKIVNLTDKEITGQSQLQLINTATNENVDGVFHNIISNQYFTIPAGQSVAVKFPMEIPFNYNSAVSYRIVAQSSPVGGGQVGASDGEEAAMPVLTNRMLVTETLPLNLRNTNNKDFKFEKLLNSKTSTSLSNEALTVEYTSNPTWYAVQALPYLMEYPYECAEQTFNRFYANAVASKIANSTPKIKAIFEQWKNIDTSALLSNLEKNQELKSALLEETPWVLAAQNESQQKKNIGLLFDMVRLSNEANKTMAKLKDMQSSNGGFVWFKGGPDDRYITQYIITKIGHLRKLGAWPTKQTADLQAIVNKALPYLDARIKDDYDYLVQHKIKLADNNLSSIAIQYLYMRSFFPENTLASVSQTAVLYYKKQAQQYWLKNGKYEQGMIALALNRGGDAVTPKAIIKSLKENSITSEEFGMYWKELNEGGYYWWQAPIETQSLLIEAFAEIDKNQTTIDDLKTWLLKQKQTQNWHTTKATSDACYALLLQGSDWLNVEKNVTIRLGNKIISSDKTEAGTGYFKQRIEGKDVTPDMGNINVTVSTKSLPNSSKEGALEVPNNTSINQKNHGSQNPPLEGREAGRTEASWGAIYWQYFEDLDKITSAKTPLSLVKKLFVEKNTDKGPVLTPINDGDEIKVGDKVKVRIELRVDRNMEYVHMKDMRAACMEPTNVISQYKYQDGLGYYESTKDASTNFFFSYLNKGVYVFEYPLNVTLSGNFSNGITTIQCMYAPEFTSHSDGVRVNVK